MKYAIIIFSIELLGDTMVEPLASHLRVLAVLAFVEGL